LALTPVSGGPTEGSWYRERPVRQLSPQDLLLDQRREKVERIVSMRTRSLAVVREDIEDPHNIAAVLRTCEGLGVQEVHAITRSYAFHPNPKITLGAEKWLDLHLYRQSEPCLARLKERGFLLCATDLAPGACSLLDLPKDRPLAIVFGTEKVGVRSETLAQCHVRFQIPMLGFSQSLNISVAAAICLSHVIFARLSAGTAGDLTETDRTALRERFFALSVKQRHRLFSERGLHFVRREADLNTTQVPSSEAPKEPT